MKEKRKNIGFKNIFIIAGFAIILAVALVLIFSKGKMTGGVIDEGVIKDCGEGTVIYKDRGLCWQQSTMPGDADDWNHANTYCENLRLGNKDDWRLPELLELRKIVYDNNEGIKIDESVFSDTEKKHYWTSTPQESMGDSHWYIHFERAYEGHTFDYNSGYGVRCVRTNSIF